MSNQPNSNKNKSALIEKAFQKYIDLWLRGAGPSPKIFAADYPNIKKELEKKLKGFQFVQKGLGQEVWQGKKLGDFEIIKELGRGGMGVVFLANQTSLGRQAALKVLPANITTDPKAVKQFYKEAKIIAKFNHPHIVPIYSVGHDQDTHFIAMGYVKGLPLNRFIDLLQNSDQVVDSKKLGVNLPIDQTSINSKANIDFIAETGLKIAEALNYAHQNGICHRDLKPSNIILTHEAEPMIVDFGLAKDLEKESLTFSGFAGTFSYAAPEQIKGLETGFKSDIWAFGLTLYELLTLQNPFLGKNISETSRNILELEPTPPRRINKAIPKDLQTIIMKCLEKEPDKRYSAKGLASDLISLIEKTPISAKPRSLFRKTRLKVLFSLALLIFVISFTVYLSPKSYNGNEKGVSKYSIEGTITEEIYGQPVRNALVSIDSKKTKSNTYGYFKLEGINKSKHIITVKAAQLKVLVKNIVVGNKAFKLSLSMGPISPHDINPKTFFPPNPYKYETATSYSDLNNNGIEEIILAYSIGDKLQLTANGFIKIIGWDGSRYKEIWKSKPLNGIHLQDLKVENINKGQYPEILTFWTSGAHYTNLNIIAYKDKKFKLLGDFGGDNGVSLVDENFDGIKEIEVSSRNYNDFETGDSATTMQYKWTGKSYVFWKDYIERPILRERIELRGE